jgi:hypothetical protein
VEINPPAGESPVEWMIITSESIKTEEQLFQIVDIYKRRWIIEEYFKALKTGCAIEKRGFEAIQPLLICLSIFVPIACQIYNLKTLWLTKPKEEASRILTAIQVKILSNLTGLPTEQLQTIESAMYAVAKVGGHIKRNGLPGWQILFRGYEKLLLFEHGWKLAMEQQT